MTRRFARIVCATLLLQHSFALAQDVLTVCQRISDAISRDSDVFYNRASIHTFSLVRSFDIHDLLQSRALVPHRH